MKEYTMDLEERKKFILGYKIKNGFMEVKYASGFKDTIPYNEENEKIVLDKMNEQVSKLDEEEFVRKTRNWVCLSFSMGSLFAFSSIILFASEIIQGMEIIANIVGYICAIGGILLIPKGFISLNRLHDYKKNKRFVEIEDDINKKVRKHENMLVNVSAKTKNIVKSTPEDKPVFNINSFNYVPNRDLEQIMENIERDEYFKYKYEEVVTQETKPKTRKRVIEDQN